MKLTPPTHNTFRLAAGCLIAAIPALATATPLRVEVVKWDANPVTENVTSYEVFVGIDRVATVTEPQAKLELPYGTSVIAVRAINVTGTSDFSAPLTIPPITSRLKITAEFSYDLMLWSDDPPQACFTRVRIEIP